MTWSTVLIILAICVILVIFYLVAKKLGLLESDLSKGKIKFSKKDEFNFTPCFTIEPVVSEDGKTYKIHIPTVVCSDRDFVITNWTLKIGGLFNGIFKQYYSKDDFGNRAPEGILMLKSNKNHEFFGLEFVPQGGYKPFVLKLGKYKANLTASTEKGKFNHKFEFIVQERNLKDYELAKEKAITDKKAIVFQLPLLD